MSSEAILPKNTKLTLKLDRSVIEQAKVYARKHGISLSVLVERYFVRLTEAAQMSDVEATGLVADLAGIASLETQDLERDYADYLAEKYK